MNAAIVERIARLLVAARHTVVLTGAGISTPSGIPDFRSPTEGLWQRTDPETVATITAFRRDPGRFYAWLRPLARQILEAQPNPAHQALAALEEAGLVRAVVTQNIDGLHQKAGSRRVLELHGHMRQATCLRCDRQLATGPYLGAYLATGEVPACPQCGGALKPNVILYGELLPQGVLYEAEGEANACDLLWVVGSSLTVAPASLLPEWARAHGARLVIVNRTPTDLDACADAVLHADVAEALPAIARACIGLKGAADGRL